MNKNITDRLTRLSVRLEELNHLLSSESATADLDNYRKLTREHSEIVPIVELYRAYQQSERDIQTAREMHADLEMRSFAEAEIQAGKEQLVKLESEIQKQLLPKDPNDERNIFLEIRAGTGGDESALFAGNLFRMYSRYAERRGWQVEIISQSVSDIGGYKEIIVKIIGHGAFSRLKFESGGHRVQRVPVTESQGRVHTSAAGVLVLPEAEVVDISIEEKDLRIDVFRSSGPGGQSVNTTDSAVRITHVPTGIVVSCQNEKSQLQNRDQAMRILRARLLAAAEEEANAEASDARRSQVRTVDRSERIRTYNFPENRISDHRTGYKSYDLDRVLDGDLQAVIDSCVSTDTEARLAALADD